MEPIICRRPRGIVIRALLCFVVALIVLPWMFWDSIRQGPEAWRQLMDGHAVSVGRLFTLPLFLFFTPFLIWGIVVGVIRAIQASKIVLTLNDEGIVTAANGLIRWTEIRKARCRWTAHHAHAYADLYLSDTGPYQLGLRGPKRWIAKVRAMMGMSTLPILITALDVPYQTIWQTIEERLAASGVDGNPMPEASQHQ